MPCGPRKKEIYFLRGETRNAQSANVGLSGSEAVLGTITGTAVVTAVTVVVTGADFASGAGAGAVSTGAPQVAQVG
jgi:hypothetical protein